MLVLSGLAVGSLFASIAAAQNSGIGLGVGSNAGVSATVSGASIGTRSDSLYPIPTN